MNRYPTITERMIGCIRGSLPWQLLMFATGCLLGSISYRNFLILSSARSGSNLLVDYLRGHWRIVCHREILNDDYLIYGSIASKSDFRKRLHVRSLFVKIPRLLWRAPRQFVGAKMLIDQFSHAGIPISDIIHDLGYPRIIVLYRVDMLETYVSRQIALRNGRWYSTTSSNQESVMVDWDEFIAYCDKERALWRQCLAAIACSCELHFIDYDSLVADPHGEVRKVLDFIGVRSNCEPVQRSVRQNPWPLSKKISNFPELEMRQDFRGAYRFLHLVN